MCACMCVPFARVCMCMYICMNIYNYESSHIGEGAEKLSTEYNSKIGTG